MLKSGYFFGYRTGVFNCYGRFLHRSVTNARGNIFTKFYSHGNLLLRIFSERHSDCIAYAMRKNRTYAYGTFDASIFAISGFRHAQVERVVHILLRHLTVKKKHRLNHDHYI